MKVMKFGGACLSTPENFLKVSEIIKSQEEKVIVVVSAISGITDMLFKALDIALRFENKIEEILKKIQKKHEFIINKTIFREEIRKRVKRRIKYKLKKLERLLYGIAYTEELTDSIKANVLSYGERFSAIILSEILIQNDKKAIAFESEKLGIVTDDSFENATANLNETKLNFERRLIPLLNKGFIPIITGYYGCTKKGKITTFGRNGSDYSAAIATYATNSPVLEIWKDVNGFMSADPKVVKNARKIDKLSYYEAAELSYFGARILHPRTVEPLSGLKTKIIIKNFHENRDKGTLILQKGYKKENVIKSVTFNKNIAVLRIYGPGVGYKPGIIGEIGKALSRKGINIYSILTSQTCINLLLDKRDSLRSYQTVKQLCNGIIEKINLVENIALVAVVGEGLKEEKGIAAKIFASVAKENVNVEMISMGASEVASYFIIKETDIEKVINAIHNEFFP